VLSGIRVLNGHRFARISRLYNLPSLPHLLKQTRWEQALPSPIVVTHDVIQNCGFHFFAIEKSWKHIFVEKGQEPQDACRGTESDAATPTVR